MDEWTTTTLGELIASGDGNLQTGPFGTVLKASEYSLAGVPVVSVGEIQVGRVHVSGRTPRVPAETKQRLPQFVLEKGDIVFGRKGGIDRNALIGSREQGWFLGSDGIRLRLSERVDSTFVSYQFRLPAVGKWLLGNSSGSIMPSLNEGMLGRLPLRFPQLKDQQEIAAALSALDAKIDLNNRINAELEALAKTIYDYWFVQFDFPDAKGRPFKSSGGKMVWNETLKREIPAGWEDRSLGGVISRSGTGLNPRDNFELGRGNNYYVTIKNVSDGRIVLDDKCDRIDDEALAIIDRRSQLQPGDVLFTSIEPVGVTYLIHEKPGNWNINESVFTIRPNTKMITSEFLLLLLSSQQMKAFTKNSSAGSIHKGIRHGVLKSFNLAYGGKSLIDQFSVILKPILRKKHVLDLEDRELTQLRDWLLPLLMNGQVKVA